MKRWTILIVVLLLMFSLACSGSPQPTEAPTQAPVNAAVTEAAPKAAVTEAAPKAAVTEAAPKAAVTQEASSDDDKTFPTLTATALEDLNSYRSTMTMLVAKDDGTKEDITIMMEETRDPLARRMTMTNNGESMEIIQVGDTQWMQIGGEWMQTAATEDTAASFGDMFFSAEDLNGANDSDYEYIGKEKVNGINTRHFRFQYDSLAKLLGGMAEVTQGTMDMWIAAEKDLPTFAVRFVMEIEGKITDQNGKGTISMDVTDINKPLTIEAPAEAQNAGLPEDIPMYPGAQGVTSFGTMTIFTSTDTVDVVGKFYTAELTKSGWTQAEKSDLPGIVMDKWQKEERSFSLTITSGDGDAGSSVMITFGE